MEEKKMCCTCKYFYTSYSEEPCKSCFHGEDRLNWVDASATRIRYSPIFKVGDLVVMKNDMGIKTIYIYLGDNWALRVPNYVLARSECNYVFSNYAYALINGNFAVRAYNIEYASHEDITEHDRRAKTSYIPETLNTWFYNLIERTLEKKPVTKKIDETFALSKRSNTDPKTTYKYKPKGARCLLNPGLDKFPTYNSNFIKRVIFSDPATIVFWEDGTKTVVKTQDGEKYDKEKGLAMAIAKRVFGNERDYYNVFKRWMRKGEERHEET